MRSKINSWVWVCLCLCAALGALGLPTRGTMAAVRLSSFTATPGNGQIDLRWETASEVGTAGFYLQRSTQSTGVFSRIGSFIPVNGDGLTGAIYTYTDPGLTNGSSYYYRLEAVNSDQTSEFHGPVMAVAGGSAAETATPSSTASFTPSATTAVAASATLTPSLTNSFTRTSTPTGILPSRTRTSTAATRLASPSVTPNRSGTVTPSGTPPTPTLTRRPQVTLAQAYPAVSPTSASGTSTVAEGYPAAVTTPLSPTPEPLPTAPAPAGSALPLPVLIAVGGVLAILVGLGLWGVVGNLRGGPSK